MSFDFDAIRQAFPLEGIVSQVVNLRRAGNNKVGCCPFHADKSPSFVVYPDDSYHCFGCSAHGDVIDFVAGMQRLSTSDAIRYLAGGRAPQLSEHDRERRERESAHRQAQQRVRNENACQAARDRWARALPVNGVGNGYLERKNVAPYGCRREGDNLLIPIYGEDGLILSVQAIPPKQGDKKLFHAGAPVTGGILALGNANTGPIVVVEGFATGATVQAATGLLVVVGFSKAALTRTAQHVAKRYPGRSIIIGADANGLEKAEDAAKAVGGRVVSPDMQGADGTDFNDQAAHFGLEDVAALFTDPGKPERSINATPFVWRATADIPKRRWLYGKHLLREFVSLDVAAGAVGKTSLKVGEVLAMATGRDLYSKGLPEGALTVWFYNLEDPRDEIERRLHATAQRFSIMPEEVGNRLYLDSGRDAPLVIATETPNGAVIARPIVEDLIAEMQDRKIDVLIVDPFISSHGVSENDNNAIDLVAREWNMIAERTGAAINLVHHVRKQNGAEANAESARGASALIGKARSVIVYNRMSADEASTLGVDQDERRFFFRVDNDKANLAPPEAGDWYRMNNVDLANGDSVGVACPWQPPDLFDGITSRKLYAAQKAVSEGRWRENIQTKDKWVGVPIAGALMLDLDVEKDRKKVTRLLRAWLAEGAFEVVEDIDEQRRPRKFVVVGKWVEL